MKYEAEFGRLLSEGIHLISIRRGWTIAAVEAHLGQALGRKGKNPASAIEYWRQGNIPANMADIEGLAHHMVEWGGLSQQWLEEFLGSIENLRRRKLSNQTSSTTGDHRIKMPVETGQLNVPFAVTSLGDGHEIRSEDLPLRITGEYSPRQGLRAWTVLEDFYGNYYLQDPEIHFLPYNIWMATNVIPGIGIERIHFLMVNGSGHAAFERMSARREWGACNYCCLAI